MTRTSPPQVAFSSGEIDPLLHRRFDYQRFQTGLAKCNGFLPLPQGGFTRAPGTWYRGATRGNAKAILVPFQFAADDALILEFTHLKMRVWRYGALVETAPGVPYELTTPYPLAALPMLNWVQSADVIYLCDGIRPVQRLARSALDSWAIAPAVFDTGPFRLQNLDRAVTLQASAQTGSITITAAAAFWAANHIGSLISLAPTDHTTVPLWTSFETVGASHINLGDRRRYGVNVYELTLATASNVGQNPPIHTEGEALSDNATKWKFVSDSSGVARITAITDTTHAVATVIKTIPQGCVDSPTYRWAEGAWSDRYGYPASVELYQQRAAYAATPSEPRTVWFSTIGDFRDFTAGTEADNAFTYTISGDGSVNQILALKRGRSGLHIFALGEEWSTRSDTQGQAIGPTTAVMGQDGSTGSRPARPIAPNGDPIFISRDGRRVLLISYQTQFDANRITNLTLPSQHLGAAGFEQIVWQGAPALLAWARMGDGKLTALLYNQAEDILGWARVSLAGGFVESLAVAPAADGSADILTMVVRRTIGGDTVRMIEEQAVIFGMLTGEDSIFDACHLFAAIHHDGAATASFALPHLVGRTVYAWTNGGEFGPLTVADDGSVTLPVAVTKAIIGLFDVTHSAETLDIQAATGDGNAMGRPKRLYSGLGVGLLRTAQGELQVVESTFGEPQRTPPFRHKLVQRAVASDLTTAWTGIAKIDAPTGHAPQLSVRIFPYHGAPLTVTAITPTVQEAGR